MAASEVADWQAAGDGPAVYAVDLSVWPRCDAEASPERGFYYHPSRHSAGQPIVAGWAYQWLAQLSFRRDSWTTPLDVRRVHPRQNANVIAVEQITNLLSRLPPESPPPLFVFDAGYDSAHLSRGVEELPVAVLVRLAEIALTPIRRRQCLRPRGSPAQTRCEVACKDPATWAPPTAEQLTQDEQYGTVRVPRPIVRGTVVLVEVNRLPARPYPPQLFWLWWAGAGTPDLDLLWRSYVRWPASRASRSLDLAGLGRLLQLRLARPWGGSPSAVGVPPGSG